MTTAATIERPSDSVRLSKDDAKKRLVRRADMVPERVAFIDCKMPGSHLKENYSLIGPGVTQSKEQKVSIPEPHGFSLGVAAMPAGITNNLHLHYTAEVFMIYEGRWVFRWGPDGKEGEIVGEAGDVVSVPTWIFRGFSNVGDGDGWIFTALGHDETGGIIWHPDIIRVAAEHGLYLTKDNMMVDTAAGASKPADDDLMEVIDEASIRSLRSYTVEEMARDHVVKKADRQWSSRGLLDSALDGHGAQVAPVLGHGISQDRDQLPPVRNPHGMSIDWVRIPAGGQVGRHRLREKQALIVFSGEVELTLNADEPVVVRVGAQDLFSFPEGSWRAIRAIGGADAEFVLMTAGDHRKHIEWASDVERAAARAGLAIDHDGYVAELRLLPPSARAALAE